MDINDFNNMIGAYRLGFRMGQWSIVGTAPMPKHCYRTAFGYRQDEKIQKKLKDYYVDRTVTKEELKAFFKASCRDMRVILAHERKTTGTDRDDNRQIILDTYERFRMADSVMANLGCDKEGEKTAVKNGWHQGEDKDWVYYHADFYYESEALKILLKEAAGEVSDEWDCKETDTSRRDTDQYACYSSFHEVWNHGSRHGTRISEMLNLSEKPPEHFTFFFRVYHKENKKVGSLQAGKDGNTDMQREIIFHIYDGKQRPFPQLYHLYEVFEHEIKEQPDRELAEYLKNFLVFTRYYGTVQMRK